MASASAQASLAALRGSLGSQLSGLRGEEARRALGRAFPGAPGALQALRGPLLASLAGGEAPGGEAEAAAEAAAFEAGRFWASLAGAFEAASREATQLSLAFAGEPPDGEAGGRLAGGVQQAALAAVSAYYRLPKGQGTTLRRAVRDATRELLRGLLQLTEALLRAPALRRRASQEQLLSTGGGVWEACDRVSALPRDNQAAVASVLSSCLGVVRDALEEMQQAQTEGGDPYGDVLDDDDLGSRGNRDVYWSEADRQLLGPCLGLVKCAKACLKKVLGAVRAHGQVDRAEQVAQLDDLADIAGDVSPSVDELALSTYPPVNQLTLRLNAAKLASVLKKMLEITRASHVCPPSEEGWVQFLAGAVDHNLDRIKGLTQGLL